MHVDYCQGLCGNLNMTKRLQEKNQGINPRLDFHLNTYTKYEKGRNHSCLRRWHVGL